MRMPFKRHAGSGFYEPSANRRSRPQFRHPRPRNGIRRPRGCCDSQGNGLLPIPCGGADYQIFKGVEGRTMMSSSAPTMNSAGFTDSRTQRSGLPRRTSLHRRPPSVRHRFGLGARGRYCRRKTQMKGATAAVAGIEPQNEAEAMLAVQMVGTNSVAWTCCRGPSKPRTPTSSNGSAPSRRSCADLHDTARGVGEGPARRAQKVA